MVEERELRVNGDDITEGKRRAQQNTRRTSPHKTAQNATLHVPQISTSISSIAHGHIAVAVDLFRAELGRHVVHNLSFLFVLLGGPALDSV